MLASLVAFACSTDDPSASSSGTGSFPRLTTHGATVAARSSTTDAGRNARDRFVVAVAFTRARTASTQNVPGTANVNAYVFRLRRSFEEDGKRYLAWHSYKTSEMRDKWAAIYRSRGDSVWEQPAELLSPIKEKVASSA